MDNEQRHKRNPAMKTVKHAVAVLLMVASVLPAVARADAMSGLYEYCEAEYPDHPTLQVFCFKAQQAAMVPAFAALVDTGVFDADNNLVKGAEGTEVHRATVRCLKKIYLAEFKTLDFILMRSCLEGVKDAYGAFRK